MDIYEPEEFLNKAIVDKVIAVMEKWFWAIENGLANYKMPNPKGKRYSEEFVNAFIERVDKFFEYQLTGIGYWRDIGRKTKGIDIDTSPEFNRLQGKSREAFVQELKEICLEGGKENGN